MNNTPQSDLRDITTWADDGTTSPTLYTKFVKPRGLSLYVPEWKAANLLVEVSFAEPNNSDEAHVFTDWTALRKDDGSIYLFTGMVTSGAAYYVGGGSCWGLQVAPRIRLKSVSTADSTVTVAQDEGPLVFTIGFLQ
jgi:hypothetical protein